MSSQTWRAGLKAVGLLMLAAISSSVSQFTLSPIYGSIPPSIHHQRMMMAAVLLAWTARTTLRSHAPKSTLHYIPVLAFSIPTLQFLLFRYSGQLGAVYGPVATELLTCFPLIFLSVYFAANLLDTIDLSRYGERVGNAGPGIASYAVFSVTQKLSMYLIGRNAGSSLMFTRSGLQFMVATFYALVLPSKFLVIAVLPLLHSASLNVHVPLERTTLALNATLQMHKYSLVARQESLTGYISVLDNVKDGFRVMRCDHSLLGGEWSLPPKGRTPTVKEPIYAVFAMLEAVRLVKTESAKNKPDVPDDQRNALVIGLGIGTTPSALIAHGIRTTIVEIDPIVHDFATRYFSLPLNHTAMIEDASDFVSRAQHAGPEQYSYDYIIHDVFTGGAEPVNLFTQEFLQGLSELLKPDGVIAINYAGDLLLPSATLVVHTVLSVFPTCRIFREDVPAPPTEPKAKAKNKDFTNMVLFCRKSNEPFAFRNVVEADCLGSQARRYNMYPQHEIDRAYFDERRRGAATTATEGLRRGNTQVLEKWQRESAVGHWGIMRTVLPDAVWENW